jgi:two-component system, cell cycle response regulator DivK
MLQPKKNKELEQLLKPDILQSKNIVIAEDDETNFLLIKEYLEYTKANILWTKDGKETIRIVDINKNIDLVLMDIQLPEVNGFEALQTIRRKHPKMPVVAITAYAVSGDRERGLKAGFNEYLAKPVSRKTLMDVILKLFS